MWGEGLKNKLKRKKERERGIEVGFPFSERGNGVVWFNTFIFTLIYSIWGKGDSGDDA